jgi:nucleotide-binding universal stress UspA family protein
LFESKLVEVTTEHEWGPLVGCILDRALKHGAGLIVLGSHGHGALYDLLVGSVAEGVLKHSKVPVLVVPALRVKKAEAASV